MRTVRKLATAGAAAFVLLGTFGAAAGPAGATEGTGDPVPAEQPVVVDPLGLEPTATPLLPVIAEPPEIVDQPVITGTATYGQTLHASPGTWTGTPTPTFTYSWQRCDDDLCGDIAGATNPDYTLVIADIGLRMQVTVVAENTEGSVPEWSDWTDEVAGILPTGPAPTISGIARVGETLTASVGPWTGPTELTTTWRWGRCMGIYACDEVEGANSPTYVITDADLGAILVARVDFSGPLGRDGAPSAPTTPVVGVPAAGGGSNATNDGSTITVSGSGFAPDTDVTVVLHSDPVVLGIAHTDAAGNFTATFAIPAGTPAGDHHLVFTGIDSFGNAITVEQAITLTGTPVAGPSTAGALLPVTGDDALPMALTAFGLMLAGALALVASRRKTSPVI